MIILYNRPLFGNAFVEKIFQDKGAFTMQEKKQSESNALLDYIAKNCEMGKSAMRQLFPVIRDQSFKRLVESQYREYDEIYDLAAKELKSHGEEASAVNPAAKLSSYVMIRINTGKETSDEEMAKLMFKGSSTGIAEITKHLNHLNDAQPQVRELADRLLAFEQRNVEELKPYL